MFPEQLLSKITKIMARKRRSPEDVAPVRPQRRAPNDAGFAWLLAEATVFEDLDHTG
jgi:hypothetical protein